MSDQDSDGESSDLLPAGEFGRLPRSRLTVTTASRRPRPQSVAGRGRAFGACCFAGKLRSPALRTGRRGLPGPLESRRPLRHSLRAGGAYPWLRWPSASVLVSAPSWGQSAAETAADWTPSGGVERPRRVVRFARLIHRRGRDLGGPYGPRRLRRQSQPDLVATQGDAMSTRSRTVAIRRSPCRPVCGRLGGSSDTASETAR
jgi:hypothetical protein